MAEFKSILIPTDFSPCADYAVDYAAALAQQLGAMVHLTHAIDTGYLAYAATYGETGLVEPYMPSVEEAVVESLGKRAEALKAKGLRVEVHVEKGSPCEVLPKLAQEEGCDLIVTGTHGYTGFSRFLFGSTCERIVRRSPIPVLAVKQSGEDAAFTDEPVAIEWVLCTTDLSDWSKAALPYAAGLCRALGAKLLLQHVIDTRFDTLSHLATVDQPDQQQMREQAEEVLRDMVSDYADLQAETSVLDGVPHSRIEETIVARNIDLLVMATHGRRGIAHALLGSTAEKVVRLAPCPVLTIRPS